MIHDVGLGLDSLQFAAVTPQEWTELARQHDRPEADGIFLSCTNTTQIEAIADIERALASRWSTATRRCCGAPQAAQGGARSAAVDAGARPPDAAHRRLTRGKDDATSRTPRRRGGGSCIVVAAATAASAQTYPTRQVTLVVPSPRRPCRFPRLIGLKMSEDLGQQIVVDNRPGANTIIGAQAVAKASPDGYTLLMAIDGTLVMNPFLYSKLAYDRSRISRRSR